MTKLLMKTLVLAASLVALFALPASAQIHGIDYVGYGWHDGVPVKAIGDEFMFAGVANGIDPVFGIDLETEELTLYVYGLLITSEVDLGGGVTAVTYSGGYLEMYNESTPNAAWGINPPNATVPSTFIDGSLFFSGEFTSMTIYFLPGGGGNFEGNLNGIAGTMIDASCTGCVYTWGGTFDTDATVTIPEGYELQVDGVLEVDAAVSTSQATWGAVKALYN